MCLKNMDSDAPVDSFANAFAFMQVICCVMQTRQAVIIFCMVLKLHKVVIGKTTRTQIVSTFKLKVIFPGLMSPGNANTSASAIGDKIGHIMNYGDGWYGGVFVGAMYTQTFMSSAT